MDPVMTIRSVGRINGGSGVRRGLLNSAILLSFILVTELLPLLRLFSGAIAIAIIITIPVELQAFEAMKLLLKPSQLLLRSYHLAQIKWAIVNQRFF